MRAKVVDPTRVVVHLRMDSKVNIRVWLMVPGHHSGVAVDLGGELVVFGGDGDRREDGDQDEQDGEEVDAGCHGDALVRMGYTMW